MDGYTALLEEDVEQFQTAIFSLFASIPYTNYNGEKLAVYEGFYSSVIYAWLLSAQLPLIMENCSNKGRIDMTILLENAVYILEFKVGGEKGAALRQIEERGYAERYRAAKKRGKKIYLIGISFDSEKRNIGEFEWKEEK